MNAESLNRGEWITQFGFFLLLALNVITLVKMFAPQKRQVTLANNPASHDELSALENRVERIETSVESARRESKTDRDALLAIIEERVVKIHDRLNEVLAAVSELKGKVNCRNRRI